MRAVLVHALDEEAAAFYARFGFRSASTEPLTLMVPLEAIRRTLGDAADAQQQEIRAAMKKHDQTLRRLAE